MGTGDIGKELDLHQVAIGLGANKTEYEPEQFPGLFYYPEGSEWFCSIFSSGKIVLSGATDKDVLMQAYSEVTSTIEQLFHEEN